MAKSRDIQDRYNRACDVGFFVGMTIGFARINRSPKLRQYEAWYARINKWLDDNHAERWRVFDERLKSKGLL